jgi:Protein of unknown function (DUF1161)
MKAPVTIAVLVFVSVSVYAQAAKPCEDLKAEIAKKLEAKNVASYSLEIVLTEKAGEAEGKVVGSCEGGSKKIVYRRTPASSQSQATEPTKP